MKSDKNEIPKTKINFALVLRTSVEDIQNIKEYLSGLEDTQVIYQKASSGRLYVREEADCDG